MTHVIEQDGVYHRRHPSSMAGDFGSHSEAWAQASEDEPKSIKTLGRTPSGIVFHVPRTTDMVSTILDPRQPKSEWDLFIIGIILVHGFLFLATEGSVRRILFLVLYIFWRASYNVGIGYLLHMQSNNNLLVKLATEYGIFREGSNPRIYAFIKRQLSDKMGKDYEFDKSPVEYHTWLLFRRIVDLILMLDFVSYVLLAVSWNNVPSSHGPILHSLRWLTGMTLVLFNLWVKIDANRVVKDFAWYWGDFFYRIDGDLTFDGVYELCMHPMYSVGYAGYYGISLLAFSYPVLFISIIAHASQFAFLYIVEEPHIAKTYNPKNKVGVRKTPSEQAKERMATAEAFGESDGSTTGVNPKKDYGDHPISQNLYIFRSFDPFKATDLTLFLIILFTTLFAVLVPDNTKSQAFAVTTAFLWRLIHFFGIGYSLRSQSKDKWWTKHFVKYGETNRKAWEEWKSIYSLSLCMVYSTFIMAAWRMYNVPADWQYGAIALRHVVGCFLIILHVWTSISIYEVLGDFGWYYGDFFVNKEKLPKLKYTGVYRYLNNPERIMGSSTFWGFALLSNSKAIFALAVQAQIANALFIKFVEQPHMAKLYAGELRKEAGFVRSLKTMPIVDQPAFKNKVSEVTGSMDKVVQDTMTVVEDFIVAAKPRWEGLKKESSVRLSRYQGSLTITRTTDCLDDLDMSQYSVRLHRTRQIDNDSPFVYQLGEPIQAIWAAPANHSATDWIGLYKITDNVSRELTKVASKGRWSGLDQAEWSDHNDNILECHESGGSIEFRGDTLPWSSGFYELRYHHDGKHNVMAISQPFQIVVETSTEQDMYKVEREVLELVQQILGSEKGVIAPKNVEEEIDFAENAEKYAGRLAYGIDKKFGVDFAWQLVETDASVHNITARIARSRKTLGPFVRSS